MYHIYIHIKLLMLVVLNVWIRYILCILLLFQLFVLHHVPPEETYQTVSAADVPHAFDAVWCVHHQQPTIYTQQCIINSELFDGLYFVQCPLLYYP